ncbi:SprT family protein [Geobacillus vulcani]|uniref:SprT family protein n=1 Tax=Geobacillus vulcani TaxID=135517 RepID=UPI0004DF6A04|nr:SprT family protein [Geobacillus vulcani]
MDQKQLQWLVEQISIHSFGKPFLHTASFNPRLRAVGGRYILQTHNIELSQKHYELFGEEELIGIIKHELCHYHLHLEGKGYRHRDRDFRELLQKVGAPRYCRPLARNAKATKTIYTYICTSCSLTYRRKRRINIDRYVCGRCRGRLTLTV